MDRFSVSASFVLSFRIGRREAIKHESPYSPTLWKPDLDLSSRIRKPGWMDGHNQNTTKMKSCLWTKRWSQPQTPKAPIHYRILLLGTGKPLVQAKHCFTVSADERPSDAADGRCSLARGIRCKNQGRRAFESQLSASRWDQINRSSTVFNIISISNCSIYKYLKICNSV